MKSKIPAVIFAGGKSSRMGRDKALLPFGGEKTLTEYQAKRLSKLFDEVYISWKSDKIENLNYPKIYDLEQYSDISAPTVGLLSILQKFNGYVFIISVDSPFFEKSEIDRLLETLSGDAVIPQNSNGIEPLIGVYHSSLAEKVKTMIESENHRLRWLLKNVDTNFIDFSEDRPFKNLNYFEEYKEALKG